ncbi:7604_t:CDS:1, partial [Rhizophagus irregularis]
IGQNYHSVGQGCLLSSNIKIWGAYIRGAYNQDFTVVVFIYGAGQQITSQSKAS